MNPDMSKKKKQPFYTVLKEAVRLHAGTIKPPRHVFVILCHLTF